MKKNGIFNKQLAGEIAGIGHGQSVLICDVGFPIPADSIRVDMALSRGIPTTFQVLQAILSELVVESFTIAQEAEIHNPEFFHQVHDYMKNQKKVCIPQDEFMVQSVKMSKIIVRSADMNPMANIVITAASAVDKFKKGFDTIPIE
jgi:D-ribose pyranase